jgi:hypothetical protein
MLLGHSDWQKTFWKVTTVIIKLLRKTISKPKKGFGKPLINCI